MTMTAEIIAEQLADLVKQVQAGNEVVLMQGNKPVARIVAAAEKVASTAFPSKIRSIKGHRVLTGSISGQELASEMFAPE